MLICLVALLTSFFATFRPVPATIHHHGLAARRHFEESQGRQWQHHSQGAVYGSNQRTAGQCPPGATGSFHYPLDCKRFVNCWKGRGSVQVCAPGTLFNPKTNECDYPSKVKCIDLDGYQSEQVPQPMGYVRFPDERPPIAPKRAKGRGNAKRLTYTEAEVDDETDDDDSDEDEEEGSRFQPDDRRQPPSVGTKHYGPPRPQHHIPRPQTTPQYSSPPGKSSTPQSYCPPGFSGHVPHPTDCRKFYHCWDGRTFEKECGPGTVFNPSISVCDHPYKVDCGNTPDGRDAVVIEPELKGRTPQKNADDNESESEIDDSENSPTNHYGHYPGKGSPSKKPASNQKQPGSPTQQVPNYPNRKVPSGSRNPTAPTNGYPYGESTISQPTVVPKPKILFDSYGNPIGVEYPVMVAPHPSRHPHHQHGQHSPHNQRAPPHKYPQPQPQFPPNYPNNVQNGTKPATPSAFPPFPSENRPPINPTARYPPPALSPPSSYQSNPQPPAESGYPYYRPINQNSDDESPRPPIAVNGQIPDNAYNYPNQHYPASNPSYNQPNPQQANPNKPQPQPNSSYPNQPIPEQSNNNNGFPQQPHSHNPNIAGYPQQQSINPYYQNPQVPQQFPGQINIQPGGNFNAPYNPYNPLPLSPSYPQIYSQQQPNKSNSNHPYLHPQQQTQFPGYPQSNPPHPLQPGSQTYLPPHPYFPYPYLFPWPTPSRQDPSNISGFPTAPNNAPNTNINPYSGQPYPTIPNNNPPYNQPNQQNGPSSPATRPQTNAHGSQDPNPEEDGQVPSFPSLSYPDDNQPQPNSYSQSKPQPPWVSQPPPNRYPVYKPNPTSTPTQVVPNVNANKPAYQFPSQPSNDDCEGQCDVDIDQGLKNPPKPSKGGPTKKVTTFPPFPKKTQPPVVEVLPEAEYPRTRMLIEPIENKTNPESKEAPPTGQILRIRGGSSHLDGYLELRDADFRWGLVCDAPEQWNIDEASVVCRELGFSRGAELSWQGYPLKPDGNSSYVSVDKIDCSGEGLFEESCNITHAENSNCQVARQAVGLRCYNNVASTCQPGEVHLGSHCYSLQPPQLEENPGNSLFDAAGDCSTKGGHLLDLNTQPENDFISEWLVKEHPNVTAVMTSGVGVQFMGMPLWVWQGTEAPMLFQKWWTGWSNERPIPQGHMRQPVCLVLKREYPCPKKNAEDREELVEDETVDMAKPPNSTLNCITDYFFWDSVKCETLKEDKLPWICERPMSDIGCVVGRGEAYSGTANTTASGKACLPWDHPKVLQGLSRRSGQERSAKSIASLKGHNYCRNVGKPDRHPWCFVEDSNNSEYCDIPHCYAGTTTSDE